MSPLCSSRVACSTSGVLGTKGLTSGSVGCVMPPPSVPTSFSEPGWLTTRLCGIASGLDRMICTGFPASTTNHFTSNSSFSGSASMRITCTPSARRSRRTARAVSAGSAAASFSPNWMTSSMAGSVRRSEAVAANPGDDRCARAARCLGLLGPRALGDEQQRTGGGDACVLTGAVDNLAGQDPERRGVATRPGERRERLDARGGVSALERRARRLA